MGFWLDRNKVSLCGALHYGVLAGHRKKASMDGALHYGVLAGHRNNTSINGALWGSVWTQE